MESFEKLKEAKKLFDEGIINEEDFQKIKNRMLSDMDNEQPAREEPNTVVVSTPTSSGSAGSTANGEGASTGMKILSFLIPLVGLILFIVDKDKNPPAAKDELMWAGIGFGVGIVLYIITVASAASYY